jgi:hypothetical protein
MDTGSAVPDNRANEITQLVNDMTLNPPSTDKLKEKSVILRLLSFN